jgi:hypothetical protein
LVIIVQVLLSVLQHKRNLKDSGKQRTCSEAQSRGNIESMADQPLNRYSKKSGQHAGDFPAGFVKSRSIVTVPRPERNQGMFLDSTLFVTRQLKNKRLETQTFPFT